MVKSLYDSDYLLEEYLLDWPTKKEQFRLGGQYTSRMQLAESCLHTYKRWNRICFNETRRRLLPQWNQSMHPTYQEEIPTFVNELGQLTFFSSQFLKGKMCCYLLWSLVTNKAFLMSWTKEHAGKCSLVVGVQAHCKDGQGDDYLAPYWPLLLVQSRASVRSWDLF